MSLESRILDVRVYPGDWIDCDIVCEGDAAGSRTVRHGKATAKDPDETDWLDWLFDAPERARQRFVVAEDGSSIEWPELGQALSVDDLIERSGEYGFHHKWQSRSLRQTAHSEELVGRWRDVANWELIDLHPDGGCGKKMLSKGKPGSVAGTLTWSVESARRIRIEHRLAEPRTLSETALAILVEQGLVDPSRIPANRQVTSNLFEYEILRFDDLALELLETVDNGLRVLGPTPIWWITSAPHRGRKSRVQ